MTSVPAPPRPAPVDLLRPVLVAVDDAGSPAALREAALVAVRAGVPVHVLHVASWVNPVGHRAENDRILSTAVAEVVSLVDGAVTVSSELAYGDAVGRIVASGHTCGLTVVQRGAVPDGRRTTDRQICVQVAARAPGAVVSVPWSWDHDSRPGTVTAGLPDPSSASETLLVFAAQAAAATGAALRVVHAVRPETTATQVRVLEDQLARLLDRVLSESTMQTRIDVVRGRAGAVLHDAADLAELLVVGRHLPHTVAGTRLGSVARSLVARGTCPVLLAPVPVTVS